MGSNKFVQFIAACVNDLQNTVLKRPFVSFQEINTSKRTFSDAFGLIVEYTTTANSFLYTFLSSWQHFQKLDTSSGDLISYF